VALVGSFRAKQTRLGAQALRQLHASDSQHALQMARDVYTRRQEGVSIWVVQSSSIAASEPNDKSEFFEPSSDKVYRHPTFYEIPSEVGHM
jgi:ring-1,2-phenylacetyl-CoA epoxidase subunit PaaB